MVKFSLATTYSHELYLTSMPLSYIKLWFPNLACEQINRKETKNRKKLFREKKGCVKIRTTCISE